jgi:hypothetical protein
MTQIIESLEAHYEAEGRANILEAWYWRTYLQPIPKRAGRRAILMAGCEDEPGRSKSGS